MKKYLGLFLFLMLTFSLSTFSEDVATISVKGSIEEIAQDGTYIIVNKQKLITTPELIEEAYFEVGDKVEIRAEETTEGLKVVSYEYTFDEEATPEVQEGPVSPKE